MGKKIIGWMAVAGWVAVIHYFSSQPDLGSGLDPLPDIILRKIAHVAEFFVLIYFLFQALRNHEIPVNHALVLAAAATLAMAGFDETFQRFVGGRQGKIYDVAIDSLGIILFVFLEQHYGKNLRY